MVGATVKKWSLKNIAKEVVGTLLMIFVVSITLNYLRQPDTNKQLPKLLLTTIDKSLVSTKQQGKKTVLHFWATWCPICKLEAPNLESIKDEVNLITIAVNSGTDEELLRFVKEHGYSYLVVNDDSGSMAKQFDVEVFPTTFIYDTQGKRSFVEVGYSTTLGLKARVALSE